MTRVGGILSDQEIRRAIREGDIVINPFVDDHVNPVSVDLTLGDEVLVYSKWVWSKDVEGSVPGLQLGRIPDFSVLDVREVPVTRKFSISERGFVLMPGIGYLMHTKESVWTNKYVPVLDGKSSIGRLFMQVHFTAGFGDPGFAGQYTLEVTVVHPLRVYAGMRVAQMRFHTISGEVERPYNGNYVGDAARGPVASRAYKQFPEKP
jgi:dCTP deaminase